ncbi:MAG: polysaccharide deacetylase family protein [Candidatus Omnitrophica bacterium]|nr:polysaccharide deacetylase family protein [Candidatus Omnitrophota bacterium]
MAPILMYHRIVQERSISSYDVRLGDFKNQLAWLAEKGYTTVLPGEAAGETTQPRVMITFDDGWESDLIYALPELEKYNFTALSFITTGFIDTPGYMSWDQVRQLASRGISVQSHAHSHAFLSDLADDAVREELKTSRGLLEEYLRRPVAYLSFPGGRFCRRTLDIARACGYTGVFTSVPQPSGRRREGLDVYGRFVVSSSLSQEGFERIVRLDRFTLMRLQMRHYLGRAAKTVLGNRRYHALWKGLSE